MTLSKTKPSDTSRQHASFLLDAIARSLLTLPFASLDPEDPSGIVRAYYKKLLESSTSSTGLLPTNEVLGLVSMIREDATIHESVGNFLKADIERRWAEGLLLHLSISHAPVPSFAVTAKDLAALRMAHEHVRVHMAHQHTWAERDAAMDAISKVIATAKEAS